MAKSGAWFPVDSKFVSIVLVVQFIPSVLVAESPPFPTITVVVLFDANLILLVDINGGVIERFVQVAPSGEVTYVYDTFDPAINNPAPAFQVTLPEPLAIVVVELVDESVRLVHVVLSEEVAAAVPPDGNAR
jgi:hypothetical protein